MIELKKEEYDKLFELVKRPDSIHNVFVYSVIEQKQEGKIFVNNRTNPTSGLVVNQGGCYYVFGDVSDNVFNKLLVEFLMEPSNHANFYDMYLSSIEWLDFLKSSLEGNVVELKRTHYVLEELNSEVKEVAIPKGFELKSMDKGLFDKYKEQIDDSYAYLWESSNRYLQHAFGFCILEDGEFASVCNTFYIDSKFIAPDIITLDKFRKFGLATLVCSQFIKKSQELRLKPYWDCDAGNEASNKLAQKLGFKKLGDVPILWWHENPKVIDNYLKKNNYIQNH
ncbi:GNAT family N-acetyltransferase [Bacillus sp. CHD6a]|uniref:GNAT family N-acetyltransferase n=1 Tax=Bacillus sp. CHD6a TaxID=1643452 RepID=UPI0006CD05D3|nr:GNAT family N-acetyltransferase [Bacillus sp. CHD6a]KPB06381.1 hypothetical protein AAV98_00865 [Bacillus sp. CHD6a]